jgi:hypothetical protein
MSIPSKNNFATKLKKANAPAVDQDSFSTVVEKMKLALTTIGSEEPLLSKGVKNRSNTLGSADTPRKRGIDKLISDTGKEEWEVTAGKVRGRVQLGGDRNDDAEVEESMSIFPQSFVKSCIFLTPNRYCIFLRIHRRYQKGYLYCRGEVRDLKAQIRLNVRV